MSTLPVVPIYLQGACYRSKDAPSGWAALIGLPDREKAVSGGMAIGTSNRAEIHAATQALRSLRTPSEVVFFTDNGVFQTGVEKLDRRRQANWMEGKWPIPNADLWREFARTAEGHRLRVEFLPKSGAGTAHAPKMNQVNALAKEAYLPLVPDYVRSLERPDEPA